MSKGPIVYRNAWTIGDARIYWYIRSDDVVATYEVWRQDQPSEEPYCVYEGEDYTTAELIWDRAVDYARGDLVRKYNQVLNQASREVERNLPSWQKEVQ